MPLNLDAVDRRILRTLQQDGRLSNVDLAQQVNLSPSPCLARVKKLESEGVISAYVALLDPVALGFGVSVFIQVRLERQVERSLGVFEQAISERPEVMECYLMTGQSDYMLRVVVPDVPALERFIVDFLSRVPGVGNIQSSFALKQVKYKTALPLPPEPARGERATSAALAKRSGRPSRKLAR